MTAAQLSGPGAPGMSHPKLTPMMEQYLRMRAEVPENTVLFYRMGDFYELFFEDAVRVGEALDIAVTRRAKHEGQPIPMCGVPVHSSGGYIRKLLEKGIAVAVCEVLEPRDHARTAPSRGGARTRMVKRGIVSVRMAESTPTTPGPFQTALEAHQRTMAVEADAGRPVRLDERLAAFARIEQEESYNGEPPRFFRLDHEGTNYEVAAYTVSRGTLFAFHTFGETEDGLCAVPSPVNIHGCGMETRLVPPGAELETVGREVLEAFVERVRYRRRREDENVITSGAKVINQPQVPSSSTFRNAASSRALVNSSAKSASNESL